MLAIYTSNRLQYYTFPAKHIFRQTYDWYVLTTSFCIQTATTVLIMWNSLLVLYLIHVLLTLSASTTIFQPQFRLFLYWFLSMPNEPLGPNSGTGWLPHTAISSNSSQMLNKRKLVQDITDLMLHIHTWEYINKIYIYYIYIYITYIYIYIYYIYTYSGGHKMKSTTHMG